jgi:hypothetical protein
VDEVTIVLIGRETERLRFTVKQQQLSPGMNTVTLFCPVRPLLAARTD